MNNLIEGSSGPLVSFLQLTLKNLNLYTGNIDGIFGPNTLNAVKILQSRNNTTSNGIVDDSTWELLYPYMKVPTSIPYTYDILMLNILSLTSKYSFLSMGYIGNSVMEKPIPYLKLGRGSKKVLYVAGTHANEWICCPIIMKFIEDYCIAYTARENLNGTSVEEVYNIATIYIVPMLNPDGIDLVTGVLNKNSTEYLNALNISNDFPNIPFPDGWKANVSGIDLNLQFPAGWDEAREIKFNQGFDKPAPRDFVGDYPLQAVESLALFDFTTEISPNIMLTYHSQGEVIFWKFLDYNPPYALEIGNKLSELSGYELLDTPYASSFAGFKDWFIQTYNLPAYTFEVGLGTNPLPLTQFDKIYSDNIKVLIQTPLLI